jgi:hypothetical protein
MNILWTLYSTFTGYAIKCVEGGRNNETAKWPTAKW